MAEWVQDAAIILLSFGVLMNTLAIRSNIRALNSVLVTLGTLRAIMNRLLTGGRG